MTFDSRTTFEVWTDLIYDEKLSRAVFDGTYPALAAARGYTPERMAVLDWFATQPGMRWNVENLRFRAALETAACLGIHLPNTARLLSRGDDDWLQDICYEYLSYYSWDALGHRRLTECERFGDYVRERIVRRRIVDPQLAHLLALELAVVGAHKRTAELARRGWPVPRTIAGAELAAARPRANPVVGIIEQPIDLRAFMIAPRADRIEAPARTTIWMIHIAGPQHSHRMKVIGEGVREVFAACTGEHTAAAIAEQLEREADVPGEQVLRILASWYEECVVVD